MMNCVIVSKDTERASVAMCPYCAAADGLWQVGGPQYYRSYDLRNGAVTTPCGAIVQALHINDQVNAAAAQTQANIDEALDMAKEGYQPLPEPPVYKVKWITFDPSAGPKCSCNIVDLMKQGCSCGGK